MDRKIISYKNIVKKACLSELPDNDYKVATLPYCYRNSHAKFENDMTI